MKLTKSPARQSRMTQKLNPHYSVLPLELVLETDLTLAEDSGIGLFPNASFTTEGTEINTICWLVGFDTFWRTFGYDGI